MPADLQSSVLCAEKLFLAAAAFGGEDDRPEYSAPASRKAKISAGEEDDRPEYSSPASRKAKISADDLAPTKEVQLGDDPAKTVKIGGRLAHK